MEVEQYQVSNGGMLYHEVQESNLCAVHCVNTVLQGPFFSEIDLAALASDLDRSEREVFHPKDDQQQQQQGSHNVSLRGDFSIQVLGHGLMGVLAFGYELGGDSLDETRPNNVSIGSDFSIRILSFFLNI